MLTAVYGSDLLYILRLLAVRRQNQLVYILIRKIDGSILANILNLDLLIGSHAFAHLDV